MNRDPAYYIGRMKNALASGESIPLTARRFTPRQLQRRYLLSTSFLLLLDEDEKLHRLIVINLF